MRSLALFHTFQAENHVSGALKKSVMPAPAQAAFAVLQVVELVLHLSPAPRTDLVTLAHVPFLSTP